jgi:hypothetical protein
MALTAPAFVNRDQINSAVLKVEQSFSPQVVRIGYSFREDATGSPAIFFRVLVSGIGTSLQAAGGNTD